MSERPGPEPLTISPADGPALEAELIDHPDPALAAVVCHPHPLYGGDMHNHVVGAVFDAVARHGAALRFNFRGTGRSEGTHGEGRAEAADVVAAIDALAGRYPGLPLIAAGYSFGADVALSVDDARLSGWLAVAPPLRVVDMAEMAAGPDPRPVIIASGTADDFRPADEARSLTADWTACEVIDVPGANHFFMTGLEVLATAVDQLVTRIIAPPA